MARRPSAAKSKKKNSPARKGKKGATSSKKKSGGILRLMLVGAFVAGAIALVVVVGSMMQLNHDSREVVAEVPEGALPQMQPQTLNHDPGPISPELKEEVTKDIRSQPRSGYLVGDKEDFPSSSENTTSPKSKTQTPDSAKPAEEGTGVRSDEKLPWREYAVASVPAGNAPIIAIVIDDAGLDRKRTAEALDLPAPITISYLPYANDLGKQVSQARAKGHEILLHMPMEPSSSTIDPGPHALYDKYDAQKVRQEMAWMLARFKGYVGINNHMGSKFTSDPAQMKTVMDEMKKRGLLFLDSRTSAKSVAYETAKEYGVPALERDVFIDDANDTAKIENMLERTEHIAKKRGFVIAIGHPRDLTLAALHKWIPAVKSKGFVLVPLTDIYFHQHPEVTG